MQTKQCFDIFHFQSFHICVYNFSQSLLLYFVCAYMCTYMYVCGGQNCHYRRQPVFFTFLCLSAVFPHFPVPTHYDTQQGPLDGRSPRLNNYQTKSRFSVQQTFPLVDLCLVGHPHSINIPQSITYQGKPGLIKITSF